MLVTSSSITASGNVTITGNLTVSGTTTTVNSNTVEIGDNILLLNRDETRVHLRITQELRSKEGQRTMCHFLCDEANDKWTTNASGTS